MSTTTLRFLLAAGIGLCLAQTARATEAVPAGMAETTQAVQVVQSDKESQDGQNATGTDIGCNGPSKDCVAVGHWEFDFSLGAGVRTDPVAHEADLPLVLIPHFSYYGKRFFIEDLDFGVTLMDSDVSTVSLIASPGYDRVYFYRSDLQNFFVSGIPSDFNSTTDSSTQVEHIHDRPRRWTYLAGPEWTFKIHEITGQLDVLHEMTAQNHGTEFRAALGIPLVEASGVLSANVGLTWKSAGIVNYYYGEPGYSGGWSLNPFAKLGYSRPLSSKWRLTAFLEYERLGNAIADSPIVNAHYDVTVFAGANYAF